MAMLTSVNGTSTLTAFIGSIEEIQTTGSSTTTTTFYAVQGKRIAANVNGTFYYFGYDALGSQVVVLNSSGNLVGSQLYGPYGNPRYSSGTLPTSIGFTGQQADSVTGLDYYVARYYDPVVGQFLSADTVQGNAQGTSPYAYVAGNPETMTDPTGQYRTCGSLSCGYGGGGNPNPPPPPPMPTNPCALSGGNPLYCGGEGGGGKPSPGTGGSGKGGGGGGHGGKLGASPPANPITTCDATCQAKERHAYQDAKADENAFQGFANFFGSIPYIVFSLIASIITIILNPVLGGIISGILTGLALLGHLAGDIASGFKQETDEEDLRTGQGLGYFTSGNLEAQGQQILGTISSEGKVFAAAGWITAVTAVFTAATIGLAATRLISLATKLGAGGASAGLATMIVAGVGSMIMYNVASSDITQEVQDAS